MTERRSRFCVLVPQRALPQPGCGSERHPARFRRNLAYLNPQANPAECSCRCRLRPKSPQTGPQESPVKYPSESPPGATRSGSTSSHHELQSPANLPDPDRTMLLKAATLSVWTFAAHFSFQFHFCFLPQVLLAPHLPSSSVMATASPPGMDWPRANPFLMPSANCSTRADTTTKS